MVEASPAYHKVLRTIDALARYYALQQVKDQIRRLGPVFLTMLMGPLTGG